MHGNQIPARLSLVPNYEFQVCEGKRDAVYYKEFHQHSSDEEQDVKYFLLWKFFI